MKDIKIHFDNSPLAHMAQTDGLLHLIAEVRAGDLDLEDVRAIGRVMKKAKVQITPEDLTNAKRFFEMCQDRFELVERDEN